eukprot:scaffold45672_cov69-Phaeocystis_antarctica.AAC.1
MHFLEKRQVESVKYPVLAPFILLPCYHFIPPSSALGFSASQRNHRCSSICVRAFVYVLEHRGTQRATKAGPG